jgi:hypothetical protein
MISQLNLVTSAGGTGAVPSLKFVGRHSGRPSRLANARSTSEVIIRVNFRILAVAFFASLPLAVSLAAEASNADALKERIIAHARTVTPEDYAYTRTIRSESTEVNHL